MKSYKYVGPNDLLELIKTVRKGEKVSSHLDVIKWMKDTDQELDQDNQVIATYIVDLDNILLIADRHSEHVVCAGGENVLSAGEITFSVEGSKVKVTEVTNQSTGYCPEPESWTNVKVALDKAGLESPGSFGNEFIFRRCEKCGLLNVVKENWFVCIGCDEDLSKAWNVS
jgi:hypothetical protein